MAEDFDVEAMLEAPYKKGVSYIYDADNMIDCFCFIIQVLT
jgi:hypothetical protein